MNYWLSPQGQVWESPELGCHYELGIKIVEEKFPTLLDENGIYTRAENLIDVLEKKGFIRYMDWNRRGWVLFGRTPNRIQVNKMFDLTGFIYDEEK